MSPAFQHRVAVWVVATFGRPALDDKRERVQRFFEEAAELAQAGGLLEGEALHLVSYVYSRPVGELKQEVGGVLNTLGAFCEAHGIDGEMAGEQELGRCWVDQHKIRGKQSVKPKMHDGVDYSQAPRAQDQRGVTSDEMEAEARVRGAPSINSETE